MDGEVTDDNIKQFYNAYIAGMIKPSLKSEPIPESQTEAVYNLVGKTFTEKVNDRKKDVLVLFYSKSCEYSKAFMPKYI
jgi:thioredoxin-like negative regulator of GroEL